MTWQWQRVDPAAVKEFKKKSAHIDTVNGSEIWRTQYGISRIFKYHNGIWWTSDRYFMTIKEATEAASR